MSDNEIYINEDDLISNNGEIIIPSAKLRTAINEQVTTSAIQILFSELDPAVSSTLYPQLMAGTVDNRIRLSHEGLVFTNDGEMTLGSRLSISGNSLGERELLYDHNKVNTSGGLVTVGLTGKINSELITFRDTDDYIELDTRINILNSHLNFIKSSNILNIFELVSSFTLASNHFYYLDTPIEGNFYYEIQEPYLDNSICIFKTGDIGKFYSFHINKPETFDFIYPFKGERYEIEPNKIYVIAVYDRVIIWNELPNFSLERWDNNVYSGFAVFSALLNGECRRYNYYKNFNHNPLSFTLPASPTSFVSLNAVGDPDVSGLEYRISSINGSKTNLPWAKYNIGKKLQCESEKISDSEIKYLQTTIEFRNLNKTLSLSENSYVYFDFSSFPVTNHEQIISRDMVLEDYNKEYTCNSPDSSLTLTLPEITENETAKMIKINAGVLNDDNVINIINQSRKSSLSTINIRTIN